MRASNNLLCHISAHLYKTYTVDFYEKQLSFGLFSRDKFTIDVSKLYSKMLFFLIKSLLYSHVDEFDHRPAPNGQSPIEYKFAWLINYYDLTSLVLHVGHHCLRAYG